jgi:hypothetical protein
MLELDACLQDDLIRPAVFHFHEKLHFEPLCQCLLIEATGSGGSGVVIFSDGSTRLGCAGYHPSK